jgi:Tol biopolymer transport system component
MDVLVYLARHPREVMSKEQILEAVWPQQFVADSVLTRAIAELRRALHDDAHSPSYIETIPKRGYRLIGEVDRDVESKPGRPPGWLLWAAVAAAALVAGALFLRVARAPAPAGEDPGSSPPYRLSQLTTSASMEIEPTYSPNGQSIAFSSDATGTFEIYVRQLTPGGREIQLTDDGQTNLQAAWSPDGRYIAYHSKGRSGVWLMPALGGQPRQLTDFGSNPAWSPDSSRLVIQSNGVWEIGANSPNTPIDSTLWIVELDGTPARQLTTTELTPFGQAAGVFSPDGERVFFSDLKDLWSIDLDGEDPRRYEHPGKAINPVVSVDGRRLFYLSSLGNDRWLSQLDLANPVTEEAPARLQRVPARDLALSPDGSRLAFTQLDSTSNLWSVRLAPDTHEPLGEPTQLTRETNLRNTGPRFSPDGETIAFQRFILGADSALWLVGADGSSPRQLLSIPGRNVRFPQWSLDGGSVYFQAFSGWNRLDLDTRQIERGLARYGAWWHQFELSPDARQIAYSLKIDGSTQIFVEDLSGENRRQLTSGPEWSIFPRWSGDGSRIAFERVRGEDTFLTVVPAAGGESRQLTFEPAHSWPWGWSPDGDKIAFAGSRDGVWNIYWVSLSDGRTRQLTHHRDGLGTFVRYPAWSPRGDQIVYERFLATADIWAMELQ